MNLSSMMGAQAQQMHHTFNSSLIKSALSTQAAQSILMLEKLNDGAEKSVTSEHAPHPSSGKNIDLKL
ncbi:polyribonucleotide nucleotidyltransferase [Salipaludibacillus sp. HK11]|uniref:polyribonucleotide nucleotidyltransferase n=1 Tax=Salipaludibacillus sp. HK11 TaxID=3394320 RepID=UPI0039FC91F4